MDNSRITTDGANATETSSPSASNTGKPTCPPSAESGNTPSNPTRISPRLVYIATAALSLIGLADTIYLTVKHLTGQSVQCTISTGCDEVLSSAYATVFGYPLAVFGALAYFTTFSLATFALFGYRAARTLLIIVVGLMTLMTLRLLYLQAFVLKQYCEFCILSAVITLTLAGLMLAIMFGSEKKKATTNI